MLLELEEVVQAKVCAEKAVQLDPTWAIARQTLGRTQLGLGEVESVSFISPGTHSVLGYPKIVLDRVL